MLDPIILHRLCCLVLPTSSSPQSIGESALCHFTFIDRSVSLLCYPLILWPRRAFILNETVAVKMMKMSPQLPTLPSRRIPCQALPMVVDLAFRQDRFITAYDCHRTTAVGNLCEDHAEELLGLHVMESDIAGAGVGLFTTCSRTKHELICEYHGAVVSQVEFDVYPTTTEWRLLKAE